METNEEPEKLYLYHDLSHPAGKRYLNLNKMSDKDIEYTRTDAFIEKAADYLNNFYNGDTHSYLTGEDIEEFIKYMKGE